MSPQFIKHPGLSNTDPVAGLKSAIANKNILEIEVVEKLLLAAMENGGQYAEIFVQSQTNTFINLDEDKIRSAQMGIIQGVGIRVINGIKVGYAYSDDFDFTVLLETAKTAAKIADQPKTIKPYKISGLKIPNLSVIRIDPGSVPIKEKAAFLLEGNDAAKKYDKRVMQVQGSYADSKSEILIANTDGIYSQSSQSMLRTFFSIIAQENNDRRTGFFGGGGRVGCEWFENHSAKDIACEGARQAVGQLGAVEAPVGEQTVVLANGWGGILLHEAIGHGLEADFIRKNTSLYAGKIGQKVASELCTVIDDGTIPNLRGTINVDDEGSLPQRKVLIEKGILKGYMYDKLNAGIMGTESTGSGRRESFKHYPMPRMTNTFLENGKTDPEEIISSVKMGFYAKTLGGGQVDISNGNFTFEVREGYRIENGKISAPVKNATLIGIGPEVLQNIDMVGNDAEFDPGIGTCGKDGQSVPVGVGLPTVRIKNLTVGGTLAPAKQMI